MHLVLIDPADTADMWIQFGEASPHGFRKLEADEEPFCIHRNESQSRAYVVASLYEARPPVEVAITLETAKRLQNSERAPQLQAWGDSVGRTILRRLLHAERQDGADETEERPNHKWGPGISENRLSDVEHEEPSA